jgi:hypothetical protein
VEYAGISGLHSGCGFVVACSSGSWGKAESGGTGLTHFKTGRTESVSPWYRLRAITTLPFVISTGA